MKTSSEIHLNVCNWWLKNRGSGFTGAIINHRLRSRRLEPHCVTTRHESLTINCVPVGGNFFLFQKVLEIVKGQIFAHLRWGWWPNSLHDLIKRWESKRSDEISAWTWVSWSCCVGRSATVRQWPSNAPEISRIHANSDRGRCALLSGKCFCRNFSHRHRRPRKVFNLTSPWSNTFCIKRSKLKDIKTSTLHNVQLSKPESSTSNKHLSTKQGAQHFNIRSRARWNQSQRNPLELFQGRW